MQDEKSPCGCTDEPACGPDCVAIERNRYFTGKYMTARDFQADPDYFLSRHRLQNRLTLGWGIVCGLEVDKLEKGDCGKRWVVIKPGIAIDCYGREIVLKETVHFQLRFPGDPDYLEPVEEDQPTEENRREAQQRARDLQEGGSDADIDVDAEKWPRYLLCIRYGEKRVEKVPALYADDTCDPQQEEYNRIRECPEVGQLCIQKFHADCWHSPQVDCPPPCGEQPKKKADSPCDSPCGPECPCREWVPLALITPTGGIDKPENFQDPDLEGRRQLHFPGQDLTRIIEINWTHGGEVNDDAGFSVKRDDSKPIKGEEAHHQLRIRFSRPLKESDDGTKLGINEATFTVWCHDLSDTTPDVEQFQPWWAYKGMEKYEKTDLPHIDPNDACVAIFPFHKYLEHLANNMVTIRLHGDFVLDCNENPADVSFLKGRFPTGNGVAGGTFLSWFKYKPAKPTKEDGKDSDEAKLDAGNPEPNVVPTESS